MPLHPLAHPELSCPSEYLSPIEVANYGFARSVRGLQPLGSSSDVFLLPAHPGVRSTALFILSWTYPLSLRPDCFPKLNRANSALPLPLLRFSAPSTPSVPAVPVPAATNAASVPSRTTVGAGSTFAVFDGPGGLLLQGPSGVFQPATPLGFLHRESIPRNPLVSVSPRPASCPGPFPPFLHFGRSGVRPSLRSGWGPPGPRKNLWNTTVGVLALLPPRTRGPSVPTRNVNDLNGADRRRARKSSQWCRVEPTPAYQQVPPNLVCFAALLGLTIFDLLGFGAIRAAPEPKDFWSLGRLVTTCPHCGKVEDPRQARLELPANPWKKQHFLRPPLSPHTGKARPPCCPHVADCPSGSSGRESVALGILESGNLLARQKQGPNRPQLGVDTVLRRGI